jgi:predicted solute-binding protein
MNKENLKELINQLRGLAKTQELSALLNHFETFLDLTNKKDEPGIKEEMEKTREQCFTAISSALFSFGLTRETMQQYFENPSNFSSEEWRKVQRLREEYLTETVLTDNKRIKLQTRRI